MTRILKIELKRAFFNRMFSVSVLIGCVISICHIVTEVIPRSHILYSPGYYCFSIFNQWIGLNYNFWVSLFFNIFPLLAALPYADSFFMDRKTGYAKNILTRTSKKHYYISKFLAVFLTGGLSVLIPLLLNLYLTSLWIPAVIPDISTGDFIIGGSRAAGAELFYTHPFLYVFLYLFLIFIVSGFLATVALPFSLFIKYRYIVLLTPFICTLLLSFASLLFSKSSINILEWIIPSQNSSFEFVVVITELFLLIALVISSYFIRGARDETY